MFYINKEKRESIYKIVGCGCKMRPQALEEVLRGLPKCTDPNVLVGTDTSDDAGVYKLTDEIALVQVNGDEGEKRNEKK